MPHALGWGWTHKTSKGIKFAKDVQTKEKSKFIPSSHQCPKIIDVWLFDSRKQNRFIRDQKKEKMFIKIQWHKFSGDRDSIAAVYSEQSTTRSSLPVAQGDSIAAAYSVQLTTRSRPARRIGRYQSESSTPFSSQPLVLVVCGDSCCSEEVRQLVYDSLSFPCHFFIGWVPLVSHHNLASGVHTEPNFVQLSSCCTSCWSLCPTPTRIGVEDSALRTVPPCEVDHVDSIEEVTVCEVLVGAVSNSLLDCSDLARRSLKFSRLFTW